MLTTLSKLLAWPIISANRLPLTQFFRGSRHRNSETRANQLATIRSPSSPIAVSRSATPIAAWYCAQRLDKHYNKRHTGFIPNLLSCLRSDHWCSTAFTICITSLIGGTLGMRPLSMRRHQLRRVEFVRSDTIVEMIRSLQTPVHVFCQLCMQNADPSVWL